MNFANLGTRLTAPLGAMFLLTACHPKHPQSSLHPAGAAAGEIALLWWVMAALLTVSFLVVMALTAVAIWRRPAKTGGEHVTRGRTRRLVLGGGIAFPGVVLLGMLFYSLGTSQSLRRPPEGLHIEVTGHQWWWEVRYPGAGVVSANEIYLPVGEPVVIILRAADVIHSFWVPNLHGKVDALPERATRIVLEADRSGEWRGQCAEFCGRQHAWMAFKVVALPRDQYDAWVEARRNPSRVPVDPGLFRRGEELFFRESCHTCHRIADTAADGDIGPDLTHIGSRLTLGAARLTNTDEHLARWVLDPQAVKPGNLMPATPLDPEDLNALVAYLRALQ